MNDIEIRQFRDILNSLTDEELLGTKEVEGIYSMVCKIRQQRLHRNYIRERISKN